MRHFATGFGAEVSCRKMVLLDFAGGTVVHVSAGVSALVAAWVLGPRKSNEQHERAHSLPMVLLGAAMLWFGWFGFNAGSSLAADGIAVNALMTTHLGGCECSSGLESLRTR